MRLPAKTRDTGWWGGQRLTPAKRIPPQAPRPGTAFHPPQALGIYHNKLWSTKCFSSPPGLRLLLLPINIKGRGMELARGRIPTTISCQAQKYSSPHQARDFPSPTQKHQEALPQKISAALQAEAVETTGSPTHSSYTKPKK